MIFPAISLLLGILQLPDAVPTPYTLWNYTWVVQNSWSETVYSHSQMTSDIPWPDLFPDLCKLANNAPPPWDIHQDPLGQSPPNLPPPHIYTAAGCSSQQRRSQLRTIPLYVCPGVHRSTSLFYECGGPDQFYCASWGCETTGNTYWQPSSSWDYITLKANYTHPSFWWGESTIPECSSWCHPLKIQFTGPGKKYHNWERGASWGIRLYQSGRDPGLLFTLKLMKTAPSSTSVSIGPDREHSRPKVPSLTQSGPSHSASTSLYQPTLPPAPSAPAKFFLSLVNASAQTLREANYTRDRGCWICFSSVPPFYEGFAMFGNLTPTNDTSLLRWSANNAGLTLNKISGLGLCLLGPSMLPPAQLIPLCNQSISINSSYSYMVAPNGTFLACSSGLTTFIVTQVFLNRRDYCILVFVFPRLTVRDPDDLLRFWDSGTNSQVRNKREPLSAISLSVLIGLGLVGTGTGIASLVTTHKQYAQLSAAIDSDLQELQSGLKNLKDSVASLAEVVLQNRRGLDLLFLQQGGLCAALNEECCFFVNKLGLVENSVQKIRESLEKRKRDREQQESWYQNWFSVSPWLTTLLPSILGPLVGILLLISFGPWLFNKLTTFVKSQVDSVVQKKVSVFYQQVRYSDSLEDLCIAQPDPLDFTGLRAQLAEPWYQKICNWSKLWKRP